MNDNDGDFIHVLAEYSLTNGMATAAAAPFAPALFRHEFVRIPIIKIFRVRYPP